MSVLGITLPWHLTHQSHLCASRAERGDVVLPSLALRLVAWRTARPDPGQPYYSPWSVVWTFSHSAELIKCVTISILNI